MWDFDGADRQLREKRHLRPDRQRHHAVNDTVLTQTGFDANSNMIAPDRRQRRRHRRGPTTAGPQHQMTFHDGSTRTKVLDPADDIVGYTDENQSEFANTFDVLGRKTAVAIDPASGVAGNPATIVADSPVPGTLAQAFEFDGRGLMTFSRDTTGTWPSGGNNVDCAFIHDSIGRKVEEQQTIAGDTRYTTHNAFTSYPATSSPSPTPARSPSASTPSTARTRSTRRPAARASPPGSSSAAASRPSPSATASPARS